MANGTNVAVYWKTTTMYYQHQLAYRPQFRRPFTAPHVKSRFGGTLASTNVKETETEYALHIVAPGRNKESFKLSVLPSRVLTVSYEASDGNDTWLHREFHLGSFERSFQLNESVDTEKISATYENGILVVTIPKKEEAQKSSFEIPVL
jgi:HSP20 family protein